MVRESIQIKLNVTNALSQRNKIIGYQKIYKSIEFNLFLPLDKQVTEKSPPLNYS